MISGDFIICRGVVQFSLPSLGVVYARPVQYSTGFDQLQTCYIQATGGYFGATCFYAPHTGQQVILYKYTPTGLCYVLASPNAGDACGFRSQAFSNTQSIYSYPWSISSNDSWLTGQRKQQIDYLMGYLDTDSNGAPCDILPGDMYIGDKNGGGILAGRCQLLIKAGDMCSIQLDAVNKKLVQTYLQKECITLHSYIKDTPNATIQLRAASVDQQFGKSAGSQQSIYSVKQQENKLSLDVLQSDTISMFRSQKVSGSAYNGTLQTVILPQPDAQLYDNQTKAACVLRQTKSYIGQYSLSAQRTSLIKTPALKAPQYTQNTQNLKANFTQPKVKQEDIDTASIDAPLLMQQALSDEHFALSQQQAQYMLQDGFYTYPTTLEDMLQWKSGEQRNAQYLADADKAQLYNQNTQTTSTVFKNTSFIQQAPDGSIFIKDGWGSQIRMSKGNIIISSALDTFIRPGRDCIQLVPRLKQVTTNGPAVFASKQSIRIGAEKDIKIASALSGGKGVTVLQNRTNNAATQGAGVVIRSNADMSITASKDMYVGLNDKTSKNAGNKVTRSTGTLILDGGSNLVLSSQNAVQMQAQSVRMFGHTSDRGSGITVQPSRVSVTAPVIDADSMFRIGQHSNNVKVNTASGSFSLQGAGVYGIQLTGFIDCRQLVSRRNITTLGNVIGGVYSTVQRQPQQQIYGLQQYSINQLKRSYAQDLKLDLPSVQNIDTATITCYSDQFICDKEFHFIQGQLYGFDNYIMPGMCWQKQNRSILQPVVQTKTGQDKQTSTYPGKAAWDATAHITCIVDNKLNKDILLKSGYYTNVDKLIQEN